MILDIYRHEYNLFPEHVVLSFLFIWYILWHDTPCVSDVICTQGLTAWDFFQVCVNRYVSIYIHMQFMEFLYAMYTADAVWCMMTFTGNVFQFVFNYLRYYCRWVRLAWSVGRLNGGYSVLNTAYILMLIPSGIKWNGHGYLRSSCDL